ncbi:hypothetical protein DES53_107222 [Roseimicrobium gellanilyticum]|uniref:Lipoprotein n=2 Tax=Roseimicrobium gellanilyticum TaxID=748857 RepID=A0A366HH45_9BACT|nr:hypothetical protein DES53_107222 [Roseimicrobium gellanilyticum]
MSGCDQVGERVQIKETREISKHATRPPVAVASADRFPQMDREAPEVEQPDPPAAEELFDWITPAGWTVVQPTGAARGIRLLDMRFGPNQEGQCFLSFLPGGGGGVEANVNRWRTQMGQAPYTAEEFAALPKKPLFGRDASYVAFDGDFTDVGKSEAVKDYRMLGAVHADEKFMIFVKMVGPKALVVENEAAFDEFCRSLQPKVQR